MPLVGVGVVVRVHRAQWQECPPSAIQHNMCSEILLQLMDETSCRRNGTIWHKFLNCMAKFGTLLLCQILPF